MPAADWRSYGEDRESASGASRDFLKIWGKHRYDNVEVYFSDIEDKTEQDIELLQSIAVELECTLVEAGGCLTIIYSMKALKNCRKMKK